MTSRLLLAVALLVPLAAIACSSSSDPSSSGDGTTGDDQNITGQPGDLNGMCGGIAGIQCKAGLKCRLRGNHPDASGKCIEEGPPMTCLAIPTCDPGDTESSRACAADEGDSCYARSMCGRTINCRKAAGESVEVEGTLVSSVGIGGENTGSSIKEANGGLTELVLGDQASKFVDGRFAKVTGKKTTLSGVETGNRPAIEVKKLLVCPAIGAVFNCMPPIAPGNTVCGEDRGWIQDKCQGVSYLD